MSPLKTERRLTLYDRLRAREARLIVGSDGGSLAVESSSKIRKLLPTKRDAQIPEILITLLEPEIERDVALLNMTATRH